MDGEHVGHGCGCITVNNGTVKKYLIFCALAANHFDNRNHFWLKYQHALDAEG